MNFVRTELGLGLTFTLIAAHASSDEKFNRNRENAHRACRTARRFMGRLDLSRGESTELNGILAELEHRLKILDLPAHSVAAPWPRFPGETFAPPTT